MFSSRCNFNKTIKNKLSDVSLINVKLKLTSNTEICVKMKTESRDDCQKYSSAFSFNNNHEEVIVSHSASDVRDL